MSFSVRCDRTNLEYRGSSLDTLFAQRRNLLRPSFYRLIQDIFRFFRDGADLLGDETDQRTLRQYLEDERYSASFIERHALPLASALWSAAPGNSENIPARWFVSFLDHHRMLQVRGRPVWRTIRGGSRTYVSELQRRLGDRLRLAQPVRSVATLAGTDGRRQGAVRIRDRSGSDTYYDHVIFGVHSDQALRLLEDPSELEAEILSRLSYQENEVVLHTDASVLPRARKAWASWNYHIPREPRGSVSVSYLMNRLQRLSSDRTYCVSLNPGAALDESQVVHRTTMRHPVFTPEAVRAQKRQSELIGHRGRSYCGAYWGFGFHEDGVRSALAVCRALESAG